MTVTQLEALARKFYDEDAGVPPDSSPVLKDREFWIAALTAFGNTVMEAARVSAVDRELAVRKISELARRDFDHLTAQDKLMGAGRTLRSIADIAAKAVGDSRVIEQV